MTRSDARQVKPKSHRLNGNLVTIYNPIIKYLETLTRNNLPILYSDSEMKNIFQKVVLPLMPSMKIVTIQKISAGK